MVDWFFTNLPWLWLGFIVLGSSLVNVLWSGVVVLRAADVRYDPQACQERTPVVDLKKALTRRHSWPRLAVPLFVICTALYGLQLVSMTLTTYTLISIGWLLTMPVREIWGISVARRVFRELHGHAGPARFWRDVREYYSLGLKMPSLPPEKQWFVGRFRWLNRFQKFRFLGQVYRFWGIFGAAAISLLWPVASAVAIFHHLDKVAEDSYLRPWWRFDRAKPQQPVQQARVQVYEPLSR
ncbi:hypothetical protein [Actinocrispum sp. NPDC049592]|uniref:hypothetical protein n=1 Tax=Actinocrispum sp. NPDC049592 TaxID=3154835 RepID=UPI0034477532